MRKDGISWGWQTTNTQFGYNSLKVITQTGEYAGVVDVSSMDVMMRSMQ